MSVLTGSPTYDNGIQLAGGDPVLSQTFFVSTAGDRLTKVTLVVRKNGTPSSDLRVGFFERGDNPQDPSPLLSSTTISEGTITTDFAAYEIDFSPADLTLTQERVYQIRLIQDDENNDASNFYEIGVSYQTNPYANGQAYCDLSCADEQTDLYFIVEGQGSGLASGTLIGAASTISTTVSQNVLTIAPYALGSFAVIVGLVLVIRFVCGLIRKTTR